MWPIPGPVYKQAIVHRQYRRGSLYNRIGFLGLVTNGMEREKCNGKWMCSIERVWRCRVMRLYVRLVDA
jgi:hypothetical protein